MTEITGLAESAKPFANAKLYRRAVLGPLSFEVGDVVELEDDDESSDLPLLGLVQCIFEGEEPSDLDIQVTQQHRFTLNSTPPGGLCTVGNA